MTTVPLIQAWRPATWIVSMSSLWRFIPVTWSWYSSEPSGTPWRVMNTNPAVAKPPGTSIFMPPVTLPVLVRMNLIGTTVVSHSRTVITFTTASRPSTAAMSPSVVPMPVGRNAITRYVPGSRSANVGVPVVVRGSDGMFESTPTTEISSSAHLDAGDRLAADLVGDPHLGRAEADVAEQRVLRLAAEDA